MFSFINSNESRFNLLCLHAEGGKQLNRIKIKNNKSRTIKENRTRYGNPTKIIFVNLCKPDSQQRQLNVIDSLYLISIWYNLLYYFPLFISLHRKKNRNGKMQQIPIVLPLWRPLSLQISPNVFISLNTPLR